MSSDFRFQTRGMGPGREVQCPKPGKRRAALPSKIGTAFREIRAPGLDPRPVHSRGRGMYKSYDSSRNSRSSHVRFSGREGRGIRRFCRNCSVCRIWRCQDTGGWLRNGFVIVTLPNWRAIGLANRRVSKTMGDKEDAAGNKQKRKSCAGA